MTQPAESTPLKAKEPKGMSTVGSEFPKEIARVHELRDGLQGHRPCWSVWALGDRPGISEGHSGAKLGRRGRNRSVF